MLRALKEHLQEFAADAIIKRVLPSVVAAWSASLTQHLRWTDTGRPLFSEASIRALTALAILAAHYAIHLWNTLRSRAAQKP